MTSVISPMEEVASAHGGRKTFENADNEVPILKDPIEIKRMNNIGRKSVDITTSVLSSAEIVGENGHSEFAAKLEEDDSATSSTSIDLFDRESATASQQRSSQRGKRSDGWQRYRSSESATSTNISSICSSIHADDKQSTQPHRSLTASSRKRMSDGSIKVPSPRRISTSEVMSEDPFETVILREQSNAAIPPAVKRRGRPPKSGTATKLQSSNREIGFRRASHISQLQSEVRPRSSIPSRLPANIFAEQCIEAAFAARLSPYSLHPGEHELLVDLLMAKEVTVYLNIRNAILRLWHQNPLCGVTVSEATGCAREVRFFGLAEVAYKWLVRYGYINFGCIEVPVDRVTFRQARKTVNQSTIVVIGAGVSGLTVARQLEGLIAQNAYTWTDRNERPPRVIVLEGRRRVGGRVYSQPLRSQRPGSLPGSLRNTAEMGAMIVTGFEHGNPLDVIIRGQLGLRYHLMKDALTIYDCDGRPVDEERDMLNTELYTDISDRAGAFRAEPHKLDTLHGDEDLINRGRDPVHDGLEAVQLEALSDAKGGTRQSNPDLRRGRRRNAPPGTEKLTGRTRVLESSNATQSAARAAKSMGWQLKDGVCKNETVSLDDMANMTAYPTLGSIMDEAIKQYQDIIDLTPQDLRLLNWHHANLEYANAAPVSSLSLSGHDQDTGNEFEGAHSEIIGGYTQLPRALMNLPTKLDVRFGSIVESVHYRLEDVSAGECTTTVVCTNGDVFDADEVVVTVPLGVLKSNMIDFDPPLPNWKRAAIDRMGFGLLNKVILLYDKPFWDDSQDMFGLLNTGETPESLDPRHYERRRGRFFLIWNASRISGRPMLVALMAGHAAHEAENTDSSTLLAEINSRLRSVFGPDSVPAPLETIVTRWKRDPFTRGTYSFVAADTRPGDYDLMAKPVGNLHFAGEATCGTHPATVHGAFLSGLRAAADVMNAIAGPINLPTPLVGPLPHVAETKAALIASMSYTPGGALETTQPATSWGSITIAKDSSTLSTPTIKPEQPDCGTEILPPMPARGYGLVSKRRTEPPRQSVCASDKSFWATMSQDSCSLTYEAEITGIILSQLGERPLKPNRPGVNPFLLYTKEKWDECKTACAESAPSFPTANPPGRDAIRATLGQWWRKLLPHEKAPYWQRSQIAQEQANTARRVWEDEVKHWDDKARRVRLEFIREHPPPAEFSIETESAGGGDGKPAVGISRRRTNTSSCVVLDAV